MVQRGWAWTRSLLGLCAHEIHICGEASAVDLVKELMLDTGDEVEVGIIMRFMVQRGWAWTRSLLGLCAQEIHICGEASAVDLVKELMLDTGDEVEVGIVLRFMVQRGWAWTRSLLGLCAHEIHICGEASAIDLVKELMLDTGDEVEVGIVLRFMVQRG